ncbi:MAG: histidine kinase [Rhizobacter sp.]|nr:histidine kinase [Ferruginibacter sp.]
MFTHKYRYLFILILSVYTYINTVLCEVYYYFGIETEWYYAFLTILLITAAIWETGRLLQPAFTKKLGKTFNKIKWLIFFFLVCSIPATLITSSIVFFISMVLQNNSVAATIVPLKLNLIYAGLANLLFHLLNAIMYYFNEYKTKWIETEELKRITAQAELQLVKSQINPHFLFNNLNVLSTLVLQSNLEANKFIEAFSTVYRYILSTNDKELVEIETELNYIQPYIFLLEKRFSEGLSIKINIPEACRSKYIIPASLQMLIENAIKHNIVSRSKPLNIDVHVNGQDNIVVSNNLQCRESVERSGQVGLSNIKKRYMLVSNREVIIEQNDSAFIVELPLLTLN